MPTDWIMGLIGGLLIGNRGAAHAMSDETQRYLFGFWTLVDEILNSVLFLLIGLEMILLVPGLPHLELAIAAIPITLAARAAAVTFATRAVPAARPKAEGAWGVLWWGGLRGGISIALALSLPAGVTRDLLLAAERERFLTDQWPEIFATIQRLGLAGDLLGKPDKPAGKG